MPYYVEQSVRPFSFDYIIYLRSNIYSSARTCPFANGTKAASS